MTDVARGQPASRVAPGRARGGGVDLATLGGIIAGLGLVAGAIGLGGALSAFLDAPSIAIVLGGTVAVTVASVGAGGVAAVPGAVTAALSRRDVDPVGAARRMLALADKARRQGLLALQEDVRRPGQPATLRTGLGLIVDGASPDEAERVMVAEALAFADRQHDAIDTLRRAADVAPAMGLIGTLVGLVQMLSQLDDPSAIGPALAVALLTTFYGAVLANMLLAPLATKLERDADREALVNDIHRTAVGSIGRSENPRRLETLINALLPPGLRVQAFD
ncbi:MAG: MotA/TolQ/ExbB proton channel family protein [Alphaproteobacteria bacterium]